VPAALHDRRLEHVVDLAVGRVVGPDGAGVLVTDLALQQWRSCSRRDPGRAGLVAEVAFEQWRS
jgi:hypothetical protein